MAKCPISELEVCHCKQQAHQRKDAEGKRPGDELLQTAGTDFFRSMREHDIVRYEDSYGRD
jgi:hypothetical protein